MKKKRTGYTGSKSALRKIWDVNKYPLLFLTPWLIGLFALSVYPIFYSLYLSFTNYNLFDPPKMVGFSNYMMLFSDTRFLQACKVTIVYVFLGVPLQLALALLLALVLNKGIPGLKYFRTAFYLPALLGGSVSVAILWRQIFGMDGIINQLLGFLGVPDSMTSISWITNPNYSLYTLILLRAWQFGSPMIIFLAALKQVPNELYESASIDGSNPIRQFVSITLPMISPVVLFNLLMQIISAFQAFTPAYIVGGSNQLGVGGALDSILMYTLYLFTLGFTNLKMGLASAMAWIMMVVIAVFTALIFKFSKSFVFYGE